ncbi:hypothetical protein COT75_03770 [Candidatus Beckwithbacteria bacterium CG10_big_fil_rev_8_21_14_0_10_34_10]|uniref:HD domain-containing protein n=1 Tax=Candidatus Beckwithbacteria bacterium CG10_big_fil_rev_8_21_14_0_10_34_10 TaxID=1974495 RepID=A0A2H0W8Q5_9BACT|nr:MAG: hypothetical protein COT75_03770 [Candidatus Beckwithbacteria bacterium CG10_big_fil_rev_8_21_14_0_10_34_10]
MLKFQIPLLAEKVITKLQKHNHKAYIVGGAIRDILLSKPTYDWDFTTDAKPEQIQKIFPESFYDNKFGTVGITSEELLKQFKLKKDTLKKDNLNPQDILEITTFRSEKGYTDRRRPDKVSWGKDLKEDLKRRDFTINSLALSLIPSSKPINKDEKPLKQKNKWQLIDPFNGQKDLKDKKVKAVGDPNKRFSEDALRMIRAIRIAAELGFTIEEKTLKAIAKNSQLLIHISFERIRDELLKILKSNHPKDGILLLDNSNLLKIILPELLKTKNITQAGHHTKDVWNHSLDSLESCPSPDPIIRLATLLHDVGKPIAYRKKKEKITFYGHEVVGERIVKKIADRLKLSKKQKELFVILVRQHMFAYDSKMTDAAIRRFIQRIGKENINNMMMLRIGDRKGGGSKATSWRLRELQERIGKLMYTPLQIKDMKVNGNDIIKILKIKPGPKVGQTLEKLFKEVLEDSKKNNREYLLKRIKEISS